MKKFLLQLSTKARKLFISFLKLFFCRKSLLFHHQLLHCFATIHAYDSSFMLMMILSLLVMGIYILQTHLNRSFYDLIKELLYPKKSSNYDMAVD